MTVSINSDLEDIYPLSPAQRGILFHSLCEPESAVYFVQSTRWLHGRLDVPAFEAAWQRAVDRHTILRTSFVWEGLEESMQVVHARVQVSLALIDWSEFPERERHDQLLSFLQADRRQGFKLLRPPLMRLTLMRMGQDASVFVWSFHHLLLDGWSAALVWQEVSAFYDSIRSGKELRLPPARPYRDHIAWIQRQDLTLTEHYWRQTLRGFTAPTALLPDLVDLTASDEVEVTEQETVLSAHTSAALRQFAQRHHLTVNTIVQGMWTLLLSHYSGEDDVVFGVTVSGRPAVFPDVEKIVGMFINTLPLRVRIRSTDRVIPWLRQLQTQQSELMDYEHCPLAQVKEWSGVSRGQPLFETIFIFQNYSEDAPSQGTDRGLTITHSLCFEKTNYPMTAVVLPGLKLKLSIAYDHGRFAATTIDQFLRHWEMLLDQVCGDPDRLLTELSGISTAARQELEQAQKGPTVEYPAEWVHQMFAAQAARAPEAIAVQFGDASCTYRQLDQRANQLARHLRTLKIGPETAVGVLLDHSINLVVAFLGILKAGAMYVPIDTGDPLDRISAIFSNAGIRALVTETRFTPMLPAHSAALLCLDEAGCEIDAQNVTAPQARIFGGSGAYIVHTSGSTGVPKGVVVTHQALLNHASNIAEVFGLTEKDRVLQFSAPAFDVAAEELYASFSRGSTVVLRTRDTIDSLPDLGRYVEHNALTVLNLPASVWHAWVNHLAQSQSRIPATLRAVIVGSEAVSSRHWALWQQLAGPMVQLWNAYGLSETTITSTVYAASRRQVAAVPIGRPIANVLAYVLDRNMEPVPFGAPGELYIGGAALARGYLNRPELTADSFVPDPFAGTPGARMYRTGDRARYLPGGNLQCLGRSDRQVKLRGYRIDLDEIEAILAQHPAVKDVAVVIWGETDSADMQLAAYVVANQPNRPAASELRRFVRTKLPHYMVPARYVLINELPLTATMKVNRPALATLADDDTGSPDTYVAPKILLQQLMAEIWADVLAVGRVGVADNFFDLGGHSLAAIRLVSRLREALAVRLEVRSIFESPTIEALAQTIELTVTAPPLADIAPRPVVRESPAPLAKDQEQVWLLNQRMPDNAFFNIVEILRLARPLNFEALVGTLTEITRRHEALRTTFPAINGKPVQMVHAPAAFPLSKIELQGLSQTEEEDAIATAASAEADRPFDLTREPPLRATLLSLRPDLDVLIFTMHHITWDGWSLDVFASEFDALYRAFVDGRSSPLEELPIQYSDFAVWQTAWLKSSAKDRQMAYWQRKLDKLPVLAFPGRRDGAGTSFRYSRVSMNLTCAATSLVMAASRRENATLFMMLMATLDVVIHIHTGSDDIPVAVQYANRNRAETEQVIGLFTNTLVLRVDLSDDPTFRDVLHAVRREALECFSNQDLPFDTLVAAMLNEKNVRLEPQVMLLFDDMSGQPLQFRDLSVTRVHRQKKQQDVIPTTFDLIVQTEIGSNGLAATFLYDRNIFEPEAIDTMVDTWREILENASSCFGRRIREMSKALPALLTPE
jgi:amino acid adenylation domain-containing protein